MSQLIPDIEMQETYEVLGGSFSQLNKLFEKCIAVRDCLGRYESPQKLILFYGHQKSFS